MIDGDFHELTPIPEDEAPDDVRHAQPLERHHVHLWCCEPPTAKGVLTQDGVTQIAFHEYTAGAYTVMDTFLNPMWQALTDFLPLSMAPNMVTSIGGLHCVVAYLVTWYHLPNYFVDDAAAATSDTDNGSGAVPNWVLLLNAYCCAVYYTLDCMDGKQARRTGTSSPLGQLFDHGVDCLCLLQHLSTVMAWMSLTSIATTDGDDNNDAYWFWTAQAVLQFSFFMAQWEEYYTGVLPHATGQYLGVTEVNYGLAFASLTNAVAFVGRSGQRAQFYSQTLRVLPESIVEALRSSPSWDLMRRVSGNGIEKISGEIQLNHLLLLGWYSMVATLCCLSLVRVLTQQRTTAQRFSALTKLLSPAMLVLAPFAVDPVVLARECRWFSLAFGLAMTQITIKMIVFSMARQAMAALQLTELVPLTLAVVWIRHDARWKEPGIALLLKVLTLGYGVRIVRWTHAAIDQICERLDINLFTIKAKSAPTPQIKKKES